MTKTWYYTGIGSREESPDVLWTDRQKFIQEKASKLAYLGYILRSGAADGADAYFEQGCDLVHGNKEIYLPWKDFNGSKSAFYTQAEETIEIVKNIHPAFNRLTPGALKMHCRNVHQVLGRDLKTPSLFLLYWTKDGNITGGSSTAINLALKYNIPIKNLYQEYKSEKTKRTLGM